MVAAVPEAAGQVLVVAAARHADATGLGGWGVGWVVGGGFGGGEDRQHRRQGGGGGEGEVGVRGRSWVRLKPTPTASCTVR